MAEYEFLVRDGRTLALLGEIRPQDVLTGGWLRHQYRPGEWRLEIPRLLIEASSDAAGADLIAMHRVLDIRRGGAPEFAGTILTRELRENGDVWAVGGYSLLDWLRRRVVAPEMAEAFSGTGETVLKALVDDLLGPSAPAQQRASGELLAGATFTIEADDGRGGSVDYQAQRRSLADVTAEICEQADLLQDIVLTDTGIEYVVREPVDATAGGGGVPFSLDMGNVDSVGWVEDARGLQNVLTIGGDGMGDARLVRTVADADSIAQHFRREGVMDARAATTTDQLDAIGAAEIHRQMTHLITTSVQPLQTASRYRQDWDVGWDVTIALPFARIPAINQRIVSAHVQIVLERGETVTMALGSDRPGVVKRLERKFAQIDGSLAV